MGSLVFESSWSLTITFLVGFVSTMFLQTRLGLIATKDEVKDMQAAL